MFRIIMVAAALLLIAVPPSFGQEEAGLEVGEIVFCTGIENRQPTGSNTQFFGSVERIYCFTRILGAAEETSVYHVWYYGDEEKAAVELPVRSQSWRTWSSKRIPDDLSGAWRVEVRDVEHRLIASGEFIYKPVEQ